MARRSKRLRRLWDTYSFEGFRAEPIVRGVFGDPKVRIVTLKRRSKKHHVDAVAASRSGGTTAKSGRCVTCPAGTCEYCLNWRCGALICRSCGKVKQERLDFLANNPFYTKRFAYFVGRRCRQASIS